MNYARAEWLVAIRRRRVLALNLLVPSGLIAALVLAKAPAVHASVVVTVLFAFFGTFGSSVPLVHDLETGRFSRLLHAGGAPGALLAQRAFVSALLDCLQLFPAAALILLTYNRAAAPAVILGLIAALVFCNVLGIWIAALTRSIGEAALLSSVCALLLLHAGGVFRTAVPGTWTATLAAVSPFAYLHAAIRAAFGLASTPPSTSLVATVVIVSIALASLVIVPRAARDFATSPRR